MLNNVLNWSSPCVLHCLMTYFVLGVLGNKEHWSALFEGQSSKKRLETLLNELKNMGLDQSDFFNGLVRYPTFVAKLKHGNIFLMFNAFSQGTSSDVPIYLRFEGQLRNLNMTKADVIKVIKEIWKAKATKDEKVASIHTLSVKHKRLIYSS